MNNGMFIVRGITREGNEVFYTGKSGQEFISNKRSASFGYVSQYCARQRAMNLNQMTPIHGVWFVAISFIPELSPSTVDIANIQEYGLTQKLSNSIRCF